ncbi:hypothetical protein C4J81_08835 [Deltaproteobacteria bacterium Smac51]|nr:hypothetical protein C4J81_08835 [Deltaproteobacteria bacterium Smac51]
MYEHLVKKANPAENRPAVSRSGNISSVLTSYKASLAQEAKSATVQRQPNEAMEALAPRSGSSGKNSKIAVILSLLLIFGTIIIMILHKYGLCSKKSNPSPKLKIDKDEVESELSALPTEQVDKIQKEVSGSVVESDIHVSDEISDALGNDDDLEEEEQTKMLLRLGAIKKRKPTRGLALTPQESAEGWGIAKGQRKRRPKSQEEVELDREISELTDLWYGRDSNVDYHLYKHYMQESAFNRLSRIEQKRIRAEYLHMARDMHQRIINAGFTKAEHFQISRATALNAHIDKGGIRMSRSKGTNPGIIGNLKYLSGSEGAILFGEEIYSYWPH